MIATKPVAVTSHGFYPVGDTKLRPDILHMGINGAFRAFNVVIETDREESITGYDDSLVLSEVL